MRSARGGGDIDNALQRLVQLMDEEDGRRDGTSAQKQHRQCGGIGWSEQTVADEEKGNPENQDD